MNLTEKIQNGIHRLPEPLVQEVLDFIGYLEFRYGLTEPNISSNGQRNCDQMAIQSIAAFRGSGKGKGTERLLADRRADFEQEA